MSLSHLIRHALSMPPHVVAAKGARMAGRILRDRLVAALMKNQTTYPPPSQAAGGLARRFRPLDPAVLAPIADDLRRWAAEARAHRFDLLGSGPVRVVRGERFGRYGMAARTATDWRAAIAAELWRGNRATAHSILLLIDDDNYQPIDWQADFRSGWRWSVRTWGTGIAYAHKDGIDVKVPWELARLQHLPRLALAHALDGDRALAREFRNQALDFMGSNPPGWGVNWACAMDVAIRAVNLIVAHDLFRANGVAFDAEFEDELALNLLAHGRHIAAHLEWSERHRGNHYLADIVGLAFIAATLARSPETDVWLALAAQEIEAEILRQFLPDGGNFEASTTYHRLSAEMALWGAALLLGLPEDRRAALRDYDAALWRRMPKLRPAPLPPLSEMSLERLARALRFAADTVKPSGEIVQIGDNDSGRLVTLDPWSPLDVSHLLAAGAGLFGEPASVEALLVAQLACFTRRAPAPPAANAIAPVEETGPAERATRVVIAADGALDGLEPLAYPDFGLFIWKNARAFVSVRCGPVGQNGQGGHAHNDQLAVEIEIDGIHWTRDPGSFTYTADLAARNRYRSVLAHFAPRDGTSEPARMLSPFSLEDLANARALAFDKGMFLGTHAGFGRPVYRRVLVGDGAIVVEDLWGGPDIGPATRIAEHHVGSPAELAALWGLSVPFSPGYGLVKK
ncbi:MAG TPA: heparinase II/III family protein [Candidatus Omnitrophota bacterium]|nr:heparinase II/III family protein [Candidatus Omnitrophota bacterium]